MKKLLIDILDLSNQTDIITEKIMSKKKLIDLDYETFRLLSHQAIDAGKDLKNYIQEVLYSHAQKGTLKKIKNPK